MLQSIPIPIKINKNNLQSEYENKIALFDPMELSPPNPFLKTLMHRFDKQIVKNVHDKYDIKQENQIKSD